MAWFPSPRGEEEGWSCLGFETNKLWKKLVGRGWFRDDCCGGGGRIWASTRGYIGSVFLKEWNLFLLVGIFFLSIYWGSRLDILLFILFFLSIDREFFGNLFYFWDLVRRSGISETLYHWLLFLFLRDFIESLENIGIFIDFLFISARWLFSYLSKILLK